MSSSDGFFEFARCSTECRGPFLIVPACTLCSVAKPTSPYIANSGILPYPAFSKLALVFGGKVVRQIGPKRVKVPSFSPHMWGVNDKRNEDDSGQEREDVPCVSLVVPRLRKDKQLRTRKEVRPAQLVRTSSHGHVHAARFLKAKQLTSEISICTVMVSFLYCGPCWMLGR
jgi:hypothetical protein